MVSSGTACPYPSSGSQRRAAPAGTKTGRPRYTVAGKSRIVDLGDARLKSLREARQDADQLRRVLDNGLHPIEE